MPAIRASILVRLTVPTSEGEFIAHYSTNGLAELRFPSGRFAATENAAEISPQVRKWHHLTVAAVKELLAGRAPDELPPLDLSRGTEFQRSVWAAMSRIPMGQTTSYGEIARAIRRPKAVRAVGGACGANPIPVLVPCHRVLAANQKIGGFGGGLDWNRRLLKRESVILVE
jgi:O-6-methylguanine DNA methyltransferase